MKNGSPTYNAIVEVHDNGLLIGEVLEVKGAISFAYNEETLVERLKGAIDAIIESNKEDMKEKIEEESHKENHKVLEIQ